MRTSITILSSVLVAASLVGCGGEQAPKQVSYVKDVKPILDQHCMACHTKDSEGYAASGLSMESYDDLLKGTKLGAVVKPGDSLSSTLVILIAGQADASIRMPHNQDPLAADKVETIRAWVDQGALNN